LREEHPGWAQAASTGLDFVPGVSNSLLRELSILVLGQEKNGSNPHVLAETFAKRAKNELDSTPLFYGYIDNKRRPLQKTLILRSFPGGMKECVGTLD